MMPAESGPQPVDQAVRRPRAGRMIWVTFAWGSCYAAILLGLQGTSTLWLAALRAVIAAVLLLGVAGIRRTPLPRGRTTWLLILSMGAINVALAYATMFAASLGLSTGAASVLANAQPLLILLPAWVIFRERPTVRTLIAMGFGFVGLTFIAVPAGLGTGAWWALLSAGAVTIGTILARMIRAEPLAVAAWQFAVGGAILALLAGLVDGIPVIEWSPAFIIALLYLAVIGTAASNVAWIAEAQHARLDQLTTWTLLVPTFGILISLVILGERQSVWAWVGTAIVMASLAVLLLPRRRLPRAPGPAGVQEHPAIAEKPPEGERRTDQSPPGYS